MHIHRMNILRRGTLTLFCTLAAAPRAAAQPVTHTLNPQTGAIVQLAMKGDSRPVEWLMKTDGSQYPWITSRYGWGLGYFTETRGGTSSPRSWHTPLHTPADSLTCYQAGDVRIEVHRRAVHGDLLETYTFVNTGKNSVTLSDAGIYTPFNDNYPDAATCVKSRVNVHIWPGQHAAYVQAVPMGGSHPALALMVTEGAINHYQISERSLEHGSSNTRGLISLNLPDLHLPPGGSSSLTWRLFAYTGQQDFCRKLEQRGGLWAEASRYVLQTGDTARVTLHAPHTLRLLSARRNGIPVPLRRTPGGWTVEWTVKEPGETLVEFLYDGGRRTWARCLAVSSARRLISKRVQFIIGRQQMNRSGDARLGACMVYDNETDEIFLNDRKTVSPADRDEGGERLGMGVLLAKQYLLTKDSAIREPLLCYARFVREKLQDSEHRVWSTTDHRGRHRAYNYPWVINLYCYMYQITGDKSYLDDAFRTMQTMFRSFGYGFYAIDIPVRLSLQCLEQAGMKKEYRCLLKDFIRIGDEYIRNSVHYPKHEVNYEQSIVAPAIMLLTQLHLVTGEKKYLDEARRQMPLLEAFAGFQPDYHLNEIAIRHWDGFWFGKREMWGDVFPHYWSTLTAAAYHYFALCTGDDNYRQRARNIVRNNLCLFFEDGKASCAYLYPYKVNGVRAGFYDPFANDQDWALVYYILVHDGI